MNVIKNELNDEMGRRKYNRSDWKEQRCYWLNQKNNIGLDAEIRE
jgi:hypothetical protein